MANISVGEADFEAVAGAAQEAYDAGDTSNAEKLDWLARKINAALSSQKAKKAAGFLCGGPKMTAAEVPSTIRK